MSTSKTLCSHRSILPLLTGESLDQNKPDLGGYIYCSHFSQEVKNFVENLLVEILVPIFDILDCRFSEIEIEFSEEYEDTES